MFSVQQELFGSDLKIKKAIEAAQNVAVTKAPVLVVGEGGTGKKSLATYIHQNSGRKNNKIIFVDCSEAPAQVENCILGHRDEASGKFHRGVLEDGNGGTVVLCNLDALTEDFQKRLYQIFQELQDYEIDVRLIATTTKNLSKLVGAGRFHRALYIYFSRTQIGLTPLRDRLGDVKFLAENFVKLFATEKNVAVPAFSQPAMDKLISHYWTYNITELKTVLEKCMENLKSEMIEIEGLEIGEKKALIHSAEDGEDGIQLMSLKEAEQLLIKKALIHTSENRTQAAKILGVSIRTLRNKINEYRNEGNNYFLNLR